MEEGEKGKVLSEDSLSSAFLDAAAEIDRELAAGAAEASSVMGGLAAGDVSGGDVSGRGGIVTARGTLDGVVVRLDARVDKASLKEAVVEFLSHRKGFLSGNEVALEWVGAR